MTSCSSHKTWHCSQPRQYRVFPSQITNIYFIMYFYIFFISCNSYYDFLSFYRVSQLDDAFVVIMRLEVVWSWIIIVNVVTIFPPIHDDSSIRHHPRHYRNTIMLCIPPATGNISEELLSIETHPFIKDLDILCAIFGCIHWICQNWSWRWIIFSWNTARRSDAKSW